MALATRQPWLVEARAILAAAPALAEPALVDPDAGLLELVTPPEAASALPLVDGLAFDPFGNLVAALEVLGPVGGLVLVDVDSGASDRIVVPITLRTTTPIGNPEGLVVLDRDGPFGARGSLYVAEDLVSGRILRVDPDTGATSVLASGLRRPEGLAFGALGGATSPALYAAETSLHRVIRIDANGSVSAVGAPLAHGRTQLVDLDRDGLPDLVAHFRVDVSGIAVGDDLACVHGALLDGRPFDGCDAIETVPARVPPRARSVVRGQGR